jgi:hypothetical protein
MHIGETFVNYITIRKFQNDINPNFIKATRIAKLRN